MVAVATVTECSWTQLLFDSLGQAAHVCSTLCVTPQGNHSSAPCTLQAVGVAGAIRNGANPFGVGPAASGTALLAARFAVDVDILGRR